MIGEVASRVQAFKSEVNHRTRILGLELVTNHVVFGSFYVLKHMERLGDREGTNGIINLFLRLFANKSVVSWKIVGCVK